MSRMRANPIRSAACGAAVCVSLIGAYSIRQRVALRAHAFDAPASAAAAPTGYPVGLDYPNRIIERRSKQEGYVPKSVPTVTCPHGLSSCYSKRRRSESNRRIEVLQTSALPLGYGAN